ncbi:DUF6676 family protein [Mycobacterium sp. 1274756.6]|uniref:Rv1476 family membrane protein n=1 Tax=Mycobacterium sp. 1274756.6 TaxID=1834076 RepID=UPI0007FE6838|nr:DUF6676 family protein [Mycobacterium sp. 1274756.6]OBJ74098.1 hypothetical protein A5643_02095 [Mycobacterium sp. 1274756.6]
MSGPVVIVPAPPHTAVALHPVLPAYIPVDVDIDAVRESVAAYGVSAPAPVLPELREVVQEARDDGIELKIVVIETNPPIDTPLRDIATLVGKDYSDATVLAISPSYAGTYSPHFDRVVLEAGEDVAKTGNPVVSAQNFLDELNKPAFPWTAFTVVLLAGVLAAAVGTRLLQLRARRAGPAADPGEPDAATAANS